MNAPNGGNGDARAFELDRVGTGSAQADEILNGGFPTHSINVIMGHPGTGKTILAEQLLFHNATPERPALYLSTLSEPLAKVVAYLQRFDFYDEDKLLDSIKYDDIGPGLLEHGIDFLEERLRDAIRTDGPRLIVIDSFKAVHDLEESTSRMRRLIARIGGLLSAYDVTTFLVGEYDTDQVPLFPEFAVADGIVQLTRIPSGRRDDRYLRVLKLRGSDYREGLHAFTIGPQGLRVFPRIVTPPSPGTHPRATERVSSGSSELDDMLDGGFWPGGSALVAGPAGSGKTTLALAFALDGVRRGEPSLFVNFQESPSQLARAIGVLRVEAGEAFDENFHLLYNSPVELQIDSVVVTLVEVLHRRGIQRVVIDALGDLAVAAGDAERFRDFLYTLTQNLGVHGVTSLLTLETRPGGDPSTAPDRTAINSLTDVILDLGVDLDCDPPERWIRVVKGRGIAHPLRRRRMYIDSAGVHIQPDDDG